MAANQRENGHCWLDHDGGVVLAYLTFAAVVAWLFFAAIQTAHLLGR
jgi:hypothetical protein